jgi:hypothetical protein
MIDVSSNEKCRSSVPYTQVAALANQAASILKERGLTPHELLAERNDFFAQRESLARLLNEARQYIELGASNALRDGRNSDVGQVLNGLADRIRAAIASVSP